LLRNGRRVALSPRVFDLLISLVQSPGQTLSRENLLKAVWGETNVHESNLIVSLCVLRKALKERSNYPRYIVTRPGKGYQFIANVKVVGPAGLITKSELQAVSPACKRKRPSIAVLPFTILLNEDLPESLGISIADAIMNKIKNRVPVDIYCSTFNGLAELSLRNSGASLDLSQIDYALRGTIQKLSGKVRVSAQLVDIRDGNLFWGGLVHEGPGDMFTLEDSISTRLVHIISSQLSRGKNKKSRQ